MKYSTFYTSIFTPLFIGLMVFGLSSCGSSEPQDAAANHDGYYIQGTTTNFPVGSKVVLQKQQGRKSVSIDTSSIKADGSFLLKGKVATKEFVQIVVNSRVPAYILLDNLPINVTMDGSNPRATVLSGNPEINALQALNNRANSGQPITKEYIQQYVDTVKSPYLAYTAMQFVQYNQGKEVYQAAEKRLKRDLPSDPLTLGLSQFIAQNEAKSQQKAQADKAAPIGGLAKNIDLPNPDGKNMSLESLKGKVVLLDFWASWCGPCRRENPNVVKNYKKYKDKGFEVFSVSLDSGKARWVQAIEKDGLEWDYHVSDLKKWSSAPARLYGVSSIPSTFLIDREGKIVAKNLRGAKLEAKLKELL